MTTAPPYRPSRDVIAGAGDTASTVRRWAAAQAATAALPTGRNGAARRTGNTPRPDDPRQPQPVTISAFTNVGSWRTGNGSINTVAWAPDFDQGLRLATASVSHGTDIWDANSGQRVQSLSVSSGWLIGDDFEVNAAWGHDRAGRVLLATGAVDGATRIWDPGTGELLHSLTGHADLTGHAYAASVAWGTTADGQPALATLGWPGTVSTWDPDTGAQLSAFPASDDRHAYASTGFGSIAWGTGTGGESLLAASRYPGGRLRIWDTSGEQPREAGLLGRPVHTNSVAYGRRADGRLVLATAEEAVHLWTQEDGELREDSLPQPTGEANVVCWSPLLDGRLLLAASTRTAVHLWDGHSLSHLHSEPLDLSSTGNDCLDWTRTPDGRLLLATASSYDQVDIWEAVLDPPTRPDPVTEPAPRAGARLTGAGRPAPDGQPAPVAISSVNEVQVLSSGVAYAVVAMGRQDDGRLVVVTGYSVRSSGAPENDSAAMAWVWDPFTGELLQTLPGGGDTLRNAVWGYRPDGGSLLATGSNDGATRVWDTSTWQQLHVMEGQSPSPRYPLAWGHRPDGQLLLASCTGGAEVGILDPGSGEIVHTLTPGGRVEHLDWVRRRDGQEVLAIVESGPAGSTMRFFDPGSWQPQGTVGLVGSIWNTAISERPGGQHVVATARSGHPANLQTISADLADTGFPSEPLPSGAGRSFAVAWAPLADGRSLLAVTGTDGLTIWDAHSRQRLHAEPLNFVGNGWNHVAWGLTADGRLLLAATPTGGGGCHVWEVTLDPPATPPEASSPAGSRGHSARPGAPRGELVLPPREVTLDLPVPADVGGSTYTIRCGTTQDGRVLLAAGRQTSVVGLWDLAAGHYLRTLTGHTGKVNGLAWGQLPDGRLLLATGSDDNTARIWDPETGQTIRTLTGHSSRVNEVAWRVLPDGTPLIATSSDDTTVRIWDPDTGQTLRTLTGHVGTIMVISWGTAPDGTPLLATGSADSTVRIWDPETGQTIRTLTGHTDKVSSSVWIVLPRGTTRLITGSVDTTIRIWDPETGQTIRTLTGHEQAVQATSIAQTLDGRLLLATSSPDRNVRIWDLKSGAELASLPGSERQWQAIAWTRDHRGNLLLVVANPGPEAPPVRTWLVEAAITGAGTAQESGPLAEQLGGSLLRLGGGGLWLPLGLLGDLVTLTGPEGASAALPLSDPKLAALAAEPAIARLRGLATRAPHWNEAARAAFAAVLASSLDIPAQYTPPPEAEPGALRDALATALAGPTDPPTPWQAAAGQLRQSALAITDQAIALLAILGPQACATDPLLPVRLARHIPHLPALSPRELRLLTSTGSRAPANGTATAGTLAHSPGTAGFARNGPLTRLLPTQLALPRDLMTIRLAEDQLLFRQHRAPVPPAPEPVTIILDTTPPTFGPAGTALRLAAHLITTTLWDHGRYPLLVTLTNPATITEVRAPADLIRIWTSATLNDPHPSLSTALATATATGQPAVLLTHHHTAREKYTPGPATRLLTTHQPPEQPPPAPSSPWHRHLPPSPASGQLAAAITALITPDHHNGNRP
jgi:WD40 repeat protein